jgi:hypothetical protein
VTLGLVVVAALVLGYLAGLLTFKVKQHWCGVCGATLVCPEPHHHRPARVEVAP